MGAEVRRLVVHFEIAFGKDEEEAGAEYHQISAETEQAEEGLGELDQRRPMGFGPAIEEGE